MVGQQVVAWYGFLFAQQPQNPGLSKFLRSPKEKHKGMVSSDTALSPSGPAWAQHGPAAGAFAHPERRKHPCHPLCSIWVFFSFLFQESVFFKDPLRVGTSRLFKYVEHSNSRNCWPTMRISPPRTTSCWPNLIISLLEKICKPYPKSTNSKAKTHTHTTQQVTPKISLEQMFSVIATHSTRSASRRTMSFRSDTPTNQTQPLASGQEPSTFWMMNCSTYVESD